MRFKLIGLVCILWNNAFICSEDLIVQSNSATKDSLSLSTSVPAYSPTQSPTFKSCPVDNQPGYPTSSPTTQSATIISYNVVLSIIDLRSLTFNTLNQNVLLCTVASVMSMKTINLEFLNQTIQSFNINNNKAARLRGSKDLKTIQYGIDAIVRISVSLAGYPTYTNPNDLYNSLTTILSSSVTSGSSSNLLHTTSITSNSSNTFNANILSVSYNSLSIYGYPTLSPTVSVKTSSSTSNSNDISTLLLAIAIAVGSALGIFVCFLLTLCVLKKRKRKKNEETAVFATASISGKFHTGGSNIEEKYEAIPMVDNDGVALFHVESKFTIDDGNPPMEATKVKPLGITTPPDKVDNALEVDTNNSQVVKESNKHRKSSQVKSSLSWSLDDVDLHSVRNKSKRMINNLRSLPPEGTNKRPSFLIEKQTDTNNNNPNYYSVLSIMEAVHNQPPKYRRRSMGGGGYANDVNSNLPFHMPIKSVNLDPHNLPQPSSSVEYNHTNINAALQSAVTMVQHFDPNSIDMPQHPQQHRRRYSFDNIPMQYQLPNTLTIDSPNLPYSNIHGDGQVIIIPSSMQSTQSHQNTGTSYIINPSGLRSTNPYKSVPNYGYGNEATHFSNAINQNSNGGGHDALSYLISNHPEDIVMVPVRRSSLCEAQPMINSLPMSSNVQHNYRTSYAPNEGGRMSMTQPFDTFKPMTNYTAPAPVSFQNNGSSYLDNNQGISQFAQQKAVRRSSFAQNAAKNMMGNTM